MYTQPPPPNGRKNGTLKLPDATEQREMLRQRREGMCGMDGERAGLAKKPDDLVAYKQLDAACDAMKRGDIRRIATSDRSSKAIMGGEVKPQTPIAVWRSWPQMPPVDNRSIFNH